MPSYSSTDSNINVNESFRLTKLQQYNILDTPVEGSFNDLAILALRLFDASHAFITFVGEDQVFFKASTRTEFQKNIPRSGSLCAVSIQNQNPTMIEDAAVMGANINIHYFRENQSGTYVAAPLLSPEGFAIGTIGVTSEGIKSITEEQLNSLSRLSNLVMDQLEHKKALRKSLKVYDDRLFMMVHDFKNQMTTVSLHSELLGRIPGTVEKVGMIASKINQQSKAIVNNLNQALAVARSSGELLKIHKEKINMDTLFGELKMDFGFMLNQRSHELYFNVEHAIEFFADRNKLKEILWQLIDNGIKYSDPGKRIDIRVFKSEEVINISVQDEGYGLLQEELNQVFMKFNPVKDLPDALHRKNGLGLSMVKMLVDMHKGRIWASSKGRNAGSTFHIELPFK